MTGLARPRDSAHGMYRLGVGWPWFTPLSLSSVSFLPGWGHREPCRCRVRRSGTKALGSHPLPPHTQRPGLRPVPAQFPCCVCPSLWHWGGGRAEDRGTGLRSFLSFRGRSPSGPRGLGEDRRCSGRAGRRGGVREVRVMFRRPAQLCSWSKRPWALSRLTAAKPLQQGAAGPRGCWRPLQTPGSRRESRKDHRCQLEAVAGRGSLALPPQVPSAFPRLHGAPTFHLTLT